jgi:hypothetical protein
MQSRDAMASVLDREVSVAEPVLPQSLHAISDWESTPTEPSDPGHTRTITPRHEDVIGVALLRIQQRLASRPTVDWPATTEEVDIAHDDRRDYPRRWARGPVTITRLPHPAIETEEALTAVLTEHGVSGELLDLSRNGLACLLLNSLARGERIGVRLTHSEHQIPLDLFARAIRSTEIGDGRWKLVAQFQHPLSFDNAYELCEHPPVA